jgi:hypothetical protein
VISNDHFRKSSFSGGASCVEVCRLADGRIAVRDSKHPDLTPNHFTPSSWKAFLTGIRKGEFDVE